MVVDLGIRNSRWRRGALLASLALASLVLAYVCLVSTRLQSEWRVAGVADGSRATADGSTADGAVGDRPSILYVLRSFPGRYDRLGLMVRTWMRKLDPNNEAVLVASQWSPAEREARRREVARWVPEDGANVAFSTPNCTDNDHGLGLCCQEARALVAAATEPGLRSHDWLFVIDEDVFVSPGVLREVAGGYNASAPLAVGTLGGCAAKGYPGFCGGGGYLISRAALRRAAELHRFVGRYMAHCKQTRYCDITTAWILERRANVTLSSDSRFHPWGYREANYPDPWDGPALDREAGDRAWNATECLVRKRREGSWRRRGAVENSTGGGGELNAGLLPTEEMFDWLLRRQDVLGAFASRRYATMHYLGGDLTRNFSTAEEKVSFMNLLYDVIDC